MIFQTDKHKIKKLIIGRSSLPAIMHVDYSSRIQTVSPKTNPSYYKLIKVFKKNCQTLINNSFNVRGEPIICTPEDAFRYFMRTEMDTIVLKNQTLLKNKKIYFKVG